MTGVVCLDWHGVFPPLVSPGGQFANLHLLQANQELRPITAADFDDARQHVTPSTNPDSMVISELKQWNATYGESGNKGYRQHLSYFI